MITFPSDPSLSASRSDCPESSRWLEGVGVLVTRPEPQAEGLCRLVLEAGGIPVVLPMFEIVSQVDEQAVATVVRGLDAFTIAIFVSGNAVRHGLEAVRRYGTAWPPHLLAAAVGPATAAVLRNSGIPVYIEPECTFSSEGLLASPGLQEVAGKRIVIFRGKGSHDELAVCMRERGARVECADVYERRQCQTQTGLAGKLSAAQQRMMEVVIIFTHREAVANLVVMAGPAQRAWLLGRPLIVISKQMADLAAQLGFRRSAWCASAATDTAIMAVLREWCSARRNGIEE